MMNLIERVCWHLIRHWLKLFAMRYWNLVDQEGLERTLEFVDRDRRLAPAEYNHLLARAGCIAYAEDRGLVSKPYDTRTAPGADRTLTLAGDDRA